jgi:hypothetical protein
MVPLLGESSEGRPEPAERIRHPRAIVQLLVQLERPGEEDHRRHRIVAVELNGSEVDEPPLANPDSPFYRIAS